MKDTSSHRRFSVRKGVLRNLAKIHRKTPVPEVSFLMNFIKKETLAQVFSCEFWAISSGKRMYAFNVQLNPVKDSFFGGI